jgi:hypothetical protein
MPCGGCNQKGVNIQIHTAEELQAPVTNKDGSIQYPKGHDVPEINGYTKDPEDEYRLIPQEDCACIWKITGILLQQDGTYEPHHICFNNECEHTSKPVTFDICKNCTFREQES